MLGGWSELRPGTEDEQAFIDQNVASINKLTGINATYYIIDSVKTQVVAGTNYCYLLTDSEGGRWFAYVYVPLPSS